MAKSSYKLQNFRIDEEETIGDEIEEGVYESVDAERSLKKEETMICSHDFLSGLYLVGIMYDVYDDGEPLKVFDNEGSEVNDINPIPLEDVKFPSGEFPSANDFHQSRLDAVGNEGYDLFVNFDDGGTTHFRFTSPDFLLGMKYAFTFYDIEEDNSYGIAELYLNGEQINNVKQYIDNL